MKVRLGGSVLLSIIVTYQGYDTSSRQSHKSDASLWDPVIPTDEVGIWMRDKSIQPELSTSRGG